MFNTLLSSYVYKYIPLSRYKTQYTFLLAIKRMETREITIFPQDCLLKQLHPCEVRENILNTLLTTYIYKAYY